MSKQEQKKNDKAATPPANPWRVDYQCCEFGPTEIVTRHRRSSATLEAEAAEFIADRTADRAAADKVYLESVEVRHCRLAAARLADAQAELAIAKRQVAEAREEYTAAAAQSDDDALADARASLEAAQDGAARIERLIPDLKKAAADARTKATELYAKLERTGSAPRQAQYKADAAALEKEYNAVIGPLLEKLYRLQVTRRRIDAPGMSPLTILLPPVEVAPATVDNRPVAMTAGGGTVPIHDNRFPFTPVKPTRGEKPGGEPAPRRLPPMMQPVKGNGERAQP